MVREAKISDTELLINLYNKITNTLIQEDIEDKLRKNLSSYSSVVYIDYENNIPVAFIQCSTYGGEAKKIANVDGLYIKESYSNKGIEKRLLKKCQDWSKQNECSIFKAYCDVKDTSSINLFQDDGFEPVGKIAYFAKRI